MSERTMCHPKTSSTAKHNDTHTCPLFVQNPQVNPFRPLLDNIE